MTEVWPGCREANYGSLAVKMEKQCYREVSFVVLQVQFQAKPGVRMECSRNDKLLSCVRQTGHIVCNGNGQAISSAADAKSLPPGPPAQSEAPRDLAKGLPGCGSLVRRHWSNSNGAVPNMVPRTRVAKAKVGSGI